MIERLEKMREALEAMNTRSAWKRGWSCWKNSRRLSAAAILMRRTWTRRNC